MTRSVARLLIIFWLIIALPAGGGAQQAAAKTPFPLPAGLEASVGFWLRVFTEFGASQLIFFDPQDLTKIYEVTNVGEAPRSNDYIDGERARVAAAHGVDSERVRAQRGVKERTAAGIKRSGRYLAQIQQIFRERGLPVELTFLPIVESSYEINARSSVGAIGIWQFMPAAGKQFGMRIGNGIDERRDPLEASRGAAGYLKQAYDSLGSWPLAITSYNYGPAGVARAVAEVGSDNLVDLIQRYNHKRWGFAPQQFYAEFLAAVEIGSNVKKYFPGLELDAPAEIKETTLGGKSSLASLIGSSGMSRDEFHAWNPALSPSVRVVPAGYRVKLPADRSTAAAIEIAKKQPVEAKVETQVVHHRVKRGETLLQIAKRYGASVQHILQANGLRHAHFVRAGTTLVIPKV